MLRTQISLTESERRILDAEAARTGRSISALIREAIDARYGADGSLEEDLALMHQAFGSWSDRDRPDGRDWVEQVRSGHRLA